jgi:hypothetical protein
MDKVVLKVFKKLFGEIRVVHDLLPGDWLKISLEAENIRALLEELDKTERPKGWRGGWGFTGHDRFIRGVKSNDLITLVDGLIWLYKDLINIPIHVAAIHYSVPARFDQLKEEVLKFNVFLSENNFYSDALGISFKSKIERIYNRGRRNVLYFASVIFNRSKPILFHCIRFLIVLFMVSALCKLLYFLGSWLPDWLYFTLAKPSLGELMLVSIALIGLSEAYNAVDALIVNTKK